MTTYQEIHQSAIRAARSYKKSQHELLVAIQNVDSKKVYLKYGFKNLYEYCLKCLLLSESTTYALIRVARKSVEIPEISKAIKEGTLSLSHAKTIVGVIKEENKSTWLDKAQTLSVRNLEKEVAKTNPEVLVREKIKPVSENRIKLECGISEKTSQMLQRAQALLSQKTGKPVNIEQALEMVFSEFLTRHDPLKKKARVSTWTKTPKHLTAAMKKERLRQDEGKCQARTPSGEPCGEETWLDVHHIRPVSQGGSHDLSNLISLCKGHHRLEHRRRP